MGKQEFNEKDEGGLQSVCSFRAGVAGGVLEDYADPDVQNEAENTHKGEFGTKRDLVSRWRLASKREHYVTDGVSCP